MCLVRNSLDPGNVLGDGCWESLKRAFAIMSTLWLGCILAVMSYFLSRVLAAVWDGAWGDVMDIIVSMLEMALWTVLLAPFLMLVSFGGFVLVPLLGLVMFYMLRSDKDITWLWYVTVLATGVIAMRGMTEESMGYLIDVVAWVIFVLVMVALAVGCWLLKGWQRNAQARHLQEVSAENEVRRLEIEQTYGTKSFGQGNQSDYQDDA